MNLSVIGVLIYISVYDVRRHKISHLSLVILALAYLLSGFDVNFRNLSNLTLLLILMYFIADIGMGDIKLLFLLGVFASNQLFTFHYLSMVWAICLLTLVVSILSNGKNRRNMPLAPAIALPLVVLYLGF